MLGMVQYHTIPLPKGLPRHSLGAARQIGIRGWRGVRLPLSVKCISVPSRASLSVGCGCLALRATEE